MRAANNDDDDNEFKCIWVEWSGVELMLMLHLLVYRFAVSRFIIRIFCCWRVHLFLEDRRGRRDEEDVINMMISLFIVINGKRKWDGWKTGKYRERKGSLLNNHVFLLTELLSINIYISYQVCIYWWWRYFSYKCFHSKKKFKVKFTKHEIKLDSGNIRFWAWASLRNFGKHTKMIYGIYTWKRPTWS